MRMRRSGLRAGVVVAMAAAACAVCVPVAHAGATVSGCPWVEFTRLPGVSTFPDSNTQVYQCAYSVGALHQTVIEGRPPRGRFWSLAVLDPTRKELDTLADRDVTLRPDGSYRVVVRAGCGATPNCLDVGRATIPPLVGLVYYRVYVPEGAGAVPAISYQPTSSLLAPVRVGVDISAVTSALSTLALDATSAFAAGGAVFDLLASSSGLDRPVAPDAVGPSPPVTRYQGLGSAQLRRLQDAGVPASAVDALRNVLSTAGFGATADNAYVTVGYDMSQGNLAIRARAPTYRAQSPTPANGLGRTDGGEQVRYWSLCTTQATRTVDCIRDENVPLDDAGDFDVVVAPSCPVAGHAACLRSGGLSAAGPAAVGTLLYRNTLAAPGFFNSDGPEICPSSTTMFCGAYAPAAAYEPRS